MGSLWYDCDRCQWSYDMDIDPFTKKPGGRLTCPDCTEAEDYEAEATGTEENGLRQAVSNGASVLSGGSGLDPGGYWWARYWLAGLVILLLAGWADW